jgi:hypothetical protein
MLSPIQRSGVDVFEDLHRDHPTPFMLILLNFKAHVIGSMAPFAPTGMVAAVAKVTIAEPLPHRPWRPVSWSNIVIPPSAPPSAALQSWNGAKLAFFGDPLLQFIGALYPILVVLALERQKLYHLIDAICPTTIERSRGEAH